MAIFRCKCGVLKTAQPFRASGEYPWECSKCAPGKKSRGSAEQAKIANDGRSYPSAPDRKVPIVSA